MRVDAGEPRAEYLARLPHLRGLYSPAVHPRVHLQVHLETWVGRDAPRARDGVSRHGQAMRFGQRELIRQEVGENQDRDFHTSAPQLRPFLDGDDGQRVRPCLDTGAGHLHGAMAVSVSLDHGHQARVRGPAFERAHVVAHGAQIHLRPGTARGPDSGGRATHESSYRRGFRTWRVRMSMRVITPWRMSSSTTGRILTLLSAMIVEASAREASGEIVISSLVITSSTGTPEIPDSAKSLIAPSTVSSGPSLGHSSCEISATFKSLMSCCSMFHPTSRRCRYCKRPGEPAVKASTPCLRLRSLWPAERRGRTRRAHRSARQDRGWRPRSHASHPRTKRENPPDRTR